MTHLLPLSSSAVSELQETYAYDHAPTFSALGHRRTNLWFDPLLDNLLNPGKGETLWFEKSKWIQIPGFKAPFKVPGTLEITLSPIAYLNDYLKIHTGLVTYNAEKLDIANFSRILLKTPYLTSTVALTAQEVILFNLDELVLEIGLARTVNFLSRAEQSVFSKGVRRSYITIESGKEAMGPLFPVKVERAELAQALLANGYNLTGEFHQLSKNIYEQRFYKELSQPASSSDTPLDTSDCEWIKQPEDKSLPPEQFGLLVRRKGQLRGGAFGIPNIEKAFIPHTYLHTFWLDPSIRGTGVGTKVINLTLAYSKQRGAQVAELGTMDFQAPLFYEKMGFLNVQTDPKLIITRDGKLNNGYLYRKYL